MQSTGTAELFLPHRETPSYKARIMGYGVEEVQSVPTRKTLLFTNRLHSTHPSKASKDSAQQHRWSESQMEYDFTPAHRRRKKLYRCSLCCMAKSLENKTRC